MNAEDIKALSDVDRLKLVVFGDEKAKIVGLVVRMDVVEEWRDTIDDERIRIKAYAAGAAVGLGLNLLSSFLVIAKLFGWI